VTVVVLDALIGQEGPFSDNNNKKKKVLEAHGHD
jgi:hypothetical protein